MIHTPAVYLLVGDSDHVQSWLEHHIPAAFLKAHEEHRMRIRTRTHPSVVRLVPPEGGYKRADVETMHDLCRYVRSPEYPLCVVVESLEAMQSSTAHLLLKLLEELPAGYIFVATTQVLDHILPTIRSRALVCTLTDKPGLEPRLMPLYEAATLRKGAIDDSSLRRAIERIEERDVSLMLDAIVAYWFERVQAEEAHEHTHQLCARLLAYKKTLPRAGSQRLFWRAVCALIEQSVA